MTKLVLIILALYLFYYAGNILFDLFFAKGSSLKSEENDQFSIHEFEKEHQTEPIEVGIEDVENLVTPNSFSKKNPIEGTDENMEVRQDLDYWRGLFESEQSIENFEEEPLQEKNNNQSTVNFESASFETSVLEKEKIAVDVTQNKERWYKLMNLAETTVHLISYRNGHKVYHSSAF